MPKALGSTPKTNNKTKLAKQNKTKQKTVRNAENTIGKYRQLSIITYSRPE
jgi:hypothetical protein